jgi:hypothetical protein
MQVCYCTVGVLQLQRWTVGGRADDRREICCGYGASRPIPSRIRCPTYTDLVEVFQQHPQSTSSHLAQGDRTTVYLRTITWSMPYPAFLSLCRLLLLLYRAHQEYDRSAARQPTSSSARAHKPIRLGWYKENRGAQSSSPPQLVAGRSMYALREVTVTTCRPQSLALGASLEPAVSHTWRVSHIILRRRTRFVHVDHPRKSTPPVALPLPYAL